MKEYEIKVSGRVQGVWFRKFTEEKAKETGIKGWVKNLPDGNVLVIAQAEKTDLDTFIDYLKIGPPMARVDKIFTSENNVLSDFDNFSIKY
ncbi:acylphosphatase [Maribellus maritimus]|uniref:acylphosphatase n=1 Tax=Maribellus maritimus TaxID=2870838 RepID=UPI001EE9E8C6|nr:acylphosphatase [Maribellus maritimus]MCG6185950.1 acylphosphatase [Maribellus maritimus]